MVEAIRLVLERRRLPGRRVHDRLPVLRRLDRPGRWVRRRSLLLEREGVRAQPRRDRHRRLLQLRLLGARDPGGEPGPERAAGDDQPCEHGTTLTRLVRGVNYAAKTSSICIRQVSGTSFGRRPPATCTATAMAQFAKQKGVKRLFLSWDGDDRTGPHTPPTREAQRSPWESRSPAPLRSTRRHGTTINSPAGSQRPAPTGSCCAALAASTTPALLRDLRAGLGRRVTLIGGEDFQPSFAQAGPAALGVYFAYPATRTSRYSPRPESGS